MGEPKETLGEHIARTQAKALDPKLSLETVAEDWGCTVRHILHLEQRGQIRIMRFGRRMCRIPLSESSDTRRKRRTLRRIALWLNASAWPARRPHEQSRCPAQ